MPLSRFRRSRPVGLGATGRALARAWRLVEQARYDDALAIYDDLLARGVTGPAADALARTDRAHALANLGRPEQALAGYDDLLARYDPDSPSPVEVYVLTCIASYERAGLLSELGQLDEALQGYDSLIDRHARHGVEQMPETAWAARVRRAGVLHRLGHPEQALTAYDEVLTHPRTAIDPPEPEQLVAAGGNKARLLADMGRPLQALATYDQLLAAHGGSGEHWQVTAARVSRAELLTALARHDDALAGYDDLLAHHRNILTTDPGWAARVQPERRLVVFEGLLALAGLLDQLQRPDEALATCNMITANHAADPAEWLRDQAVTALHRGGDLLERLGRHPEALRAYDRAEQILLQR